MIGWVEIDDLIRDIEDRLLALERVEQELALEGEVAPPVDGVVKVD